MYAHSKAALVAALVATGTLGLGVAHAATESTAASVIEVSTAAELTSALSDAEPGDTIEMANGTYSGHFTADTNGTSSKPITLTGSAKAVINGGSTSSGYAFHLQANYWKLSGFTITNSQKGVMADGANHNVLDDLTVNHVGDEAVHFRCSSSDNVIQNSTITDTGNREPGYGEGIYFGQANSNWDTCGGSDPSNRNKALNNKVGPDVRAEGIDIKEGTTGGEVRDNTFDGTGMAGENSADSWVDVKGNDYEIVGNEGSDSLLDGFQTHIPLSGWGEDNVFAKNTADVGASGYGFKIQKDGSSAAGNVVCTNNTVTNADSGVANITLTSSCPVS